MGRKIGLGRIWSFVLGFRSLVARLVPFERGGTKPEGEKIFGNGKCELIANFSATVVTFPWRERREVWNERCEFLARESVSSSPIMRIFGKWKCKFIAKVSAKMVTSLPSLSLCLYLSLSLSLSPKVPHAQYRKRFRASYNTCARDGWRTQHAHRNRSFLFLFRFLLFFFNASSSSQGGFSAHFAQCSYAPADSDLKALHSNVMLH